MSWESYCVHRYSCKLILSSGRGLQEAYCKRIFVMSRQQQNRSASYPAYFCIVYYINGAIYGHKYTKRARKYPLARFELKFGACACNCYQAFYQRPGNEATDRHITSYSLGSNYPKTVELSSPKLNAYKS